MTEIKLHLISTSFHILDTFEICFFCNGNFLHLALRFRVMNERDNELFGDDLSTFYHRSGKGPTVCCALPLPLVGKVRPSLK